MKRRRLWLSSVGLCTNVASNVAILPSLASLCLERQLEKRERIVRRMLSDESVARRYGIEA